MNSRLLAALLAGTLAAPAGVLRWMNAYQWEGGWHSREELHHGIVTSDGGYLGCGYVGYRNTSMSQEMLLLKVDSAGNELWHRFYDNDERAKYGEAVIETADHGFLVVGHKTVGNDTTFTVLLRTDSAGVEVWTRMFHSYESPKAYGLAVAPGPDGGWVVAGKVGSG